MLQIVINQFGVPHYDAARGRYLMTDTATGEMYWLDDQAYAESRDYMVRGYIQDGKTEAEAVLLAETEAFAGWSTDMEGIEQAN